MRNPLIASLFDESERRPLSISELTSQVRASLESRFSAVWVEGEISNFKAHSSGHWYFSIKDQSAQLRATCFRQTNNRIRFRPSNGLQVRARGRLTVYEPRGDYELCVEALDPVGAGALRIAFEQLRDRLEAEGLFDEALKRPIPLFPARIGVVTSASGAAIHDILQIIKRRTRTVHVLFTPVHVQGEGAGSEIARAIKLLNDYSSGVLQAVEGADGQSERIDVIIIGRGGGSTEDLWAFNEEEVARAIRASQIPVISAVGHETDFTIADFAADLRASTPSAAAEIVAAREDEIIARREDLTRAMIRAMHYRLLHEQSRLQEATMSAGFDEVRERLNSASFAAAMAMERIRAAMTQKLTLARHLVETSQCRLSPVYMAARSAQIRIRLTKLEQALQSSAKTIIDSRRAQIGVSAASLDALSPLAVLKRGYALAENEEGETLRSARFVQGGDRVRVRLAEGSLRCRVEEVEKS